MRLIDADELLKQAIPMSWSNQKWVSEVTIGLMSTVDTQLEQSFKGMTNGEVLKKLFPNISINNNPLFEKIYTEIPFNDYVGANIDCMRDWWNKPYKENK